MDEDNNNNNNIGFSNADNNSFMGRIFLAAERFCPPGASSIYINIGGNTRGRQLYPDYASETVLHEICEEQQYNELLESLKPRSCGLVSGLQGIVADHGAGRIGTAGPWRHPIRLEFYDQFIEVSRELVAYDQNGKACTKIYIDDGYVKEPRAIWPPPGFNIIVDIKDDGDLRQRWTRNPDADIDITAGLLAGARHLFGIGGGNSDPVASTPQEHGGGNSDPVASTPQEHGGGNFYSEASAPPAQEPMNRYLGSSDARIHPGGDASGGHITAELQKLIDLKTQGLLSDAEFEAAKAKVLSS